MFVAIFVFLAACFGENDLFVRSIGIWIAIIFGGWALVSVFSVFFYPIKTSIMSIGLGLFIALLGAHIDNKHEYKEYPNHTELSQTKDNMILGECPDAQWLIYVKFTSATHGIPMWRHIRFTGNLEASEQVLARYVKYHEDLWPDEPIEYISKELVFVPKRWLIENKIPLVSSLTVSYEQEENVPEPDEINWNDLVSN